MDHDERLNLEIINEEASIWFMIDLYGTPTVIIKAPSNTVKSIINGCNTEILVGIDKSRNAPIVHIGIKIFDFPENPMILSGSNRFEEDNIYLIKFLRSQESRVALYSELGICVALGNANLNQSMADRALKLVGDPLNLYIGDFSEEVMNSLDCFDFTVDKTRASKNVYEIEIISVDCIFNNWSDMIRDFIGLNTQEEFSIKDINEGSTLESQVWFSIEDLFHFNIHLNPQFSTKDGSKELTDILAFYELGIFIFETKCLSIYSTSSPPSLDRKVRNLQNHIKKAIRQLIGAKNKIQSKNEIFTKKGKLIDFNRYIIPHCTVLVSELIPFGDWTEIENEIIRATIEEKIYLHIMDFREFINFVKNSQGKKENLDYLFMDRAQGFAETRSIHMRSKFERPNNQ
tara:strand:- start:1423 stop:2628 length:1206 start_codon:yes stop_codon:yes gene_type:complete